MHFFECVRLAFRNIGVNKLRSFLTMLGIIIGISSVITITTIGNSLKQTISHTMSDLGGANLIYGYLDAKIPEDVDWETYIYPDLNDNDYITPELLETYEKEFEGKVKSILLSEWSGSGIVNNGELYANCEVQGTSEGYLDYSGLELLYGRDITARDNKECKYTAVVSDLFANNLFDGANPIGKQIYLPVDESTTHEFTIVGVYEFNARMSGGMDPSISDADRSSTVFVPVQALYDAKGKTPGYSYLEILTEQDADPTTVSSETQEFFEDAYKTNPNWTFVCYDMASELGIITTVVDVITLAVTVIASISLVVGGVGVMNIMLVSIVERTREIGIRKALGARNSIIRGQFLTEAVIICLIGGTIGILIGIGNGFLLAKVGTMVLESFYSDYVNIISFTIQPSLFAIIISVAFSMLIGIAFGYYPANRAAKMSPITALGYE